MKTRIIVKTGAILRERVDAIIAGIYEDSADLNLSPHAREINRLLDGAIDDVLRRKGFTGKRKQIEVINTGEAIPATYVIICGLGKIEKVGLEQIRQAVGRASLRAREMGLRTLAAAATSFSYKMEDTTIHDVGEAIVEGALLALYKFSKYKVMESNNSKYIEEIRLVEGDKNKVGEVEKGVEQGKVISESVTFVRDLINSPANEMTPSILAEVAKKVAKVNRIRCTILSKRQIERLGMGAYLGVAKGSQEPPKFIILEYNGSKRGDKPMVIVGKAITFDSGGISLKPSEGMGKMKYDMAGGAITIGVVRAASLLHLPLNLIGLLPATENMPGGAASRPGDILHSMSGRTIEIVSTDAEGRLALSDALYYATRYKPRWIIDIATLTGACVIALGEHAIGMLGNDKELKERLTKAGDKTWERVWEMPLWDEYIEQIKSPIADMKNSGGKGGGVITAAGFLSKFVEGYPWAHLDIAGIAWNDTDKSYIPAGASGVGVRLLVQLLIDVALEGKP